MKCPDCGNDIELYEWIKTTACHECWHDYWEDEKIGENESWDDFFMNLTKVEKKK